jgi:hypothetical protein
MFGRKKAAMPVPAALAVRLCLPDAEAHPPDEGKDAGNDRDDTGDTVLVVAEEAVDKVRDASQTQNAVWSFQAILKAI